MRKWITLPILIGVFLAVLYYQREEDSDAVLAIALRLPGEMGLSPQQRELLEGVIREVHPIAMEAARGLRADGARFDNERYKRELFAAVADRLGNPGQEKLRIRWLEEEENFGITAEVQR